MKHPIIITSSGEIKNRLNYLYNNIISKYLFTPSGRLKLAQSMIAPIQRRLNYQAVSRQVLPVQSMPLPGSLVYDIDPTLPPGTLSVYNSKSEGYVELPKYKFDAIKISSDGEIYRKGRRVVSPFRRVTFPTFDLYSNPTIKLSAVKSRRFNIIDRAVLKARESIMSQENANIFDMLDKLSGKK